MKTLLQITMIILAISLLSSCRTYYAPNAHNVPLFQEEDEVRLSGSYCVGEYVQGGELQGAVALKNNNAIMGNASFVTDDYSNIKFFELGYGRYKTLQRNGVAELYGGMGWGSNKCEDEPTLNSMRFFLQPSIGYTSRVFDIAVSSRFCGLKFSNYNQIYDEFERRALERFSVLFEPALTMRLGWKNVKVQGQFGYSYNINNQDLLQDRFNLNIGLYISLTDKYRKARYNSKI